MRYFFGKQQRVVRNQEFTRIIRQGVCVADGTLVLFASRSEPGTQPRLGVTIPKRVGNAVTRNRWKRLIRESFRTQQDQIPAGYDYVVRPKKGARLDWSQIQRSIPHLANRAAG